MNRIVTIGLILLLTTVCLVAANRAADKQEKSSMQNEKPKEFKVYPIGYVRKSQGKTTIVVDKKFQAGLMGLEKFPEVWVLYWFDRNDTPEKRSILQVHPRGNKNNPKRGVFATHSPFRPNLIAMSRCKVISVKGNVVEIDCIDAFADTPVLDLKN
ncbi:MAG: tRNA (N6-threonylcarbamoyladenosine(37)-N6)-methyltransferase TrmO [Pirellulales bacterium]|nr:tRNA (N6-threonylcarbamoyladenosine(37)-N6)-methyltransferase TrmO [Pirellulales bacterium]